ncbi:MAG: arginine N-succinyltransferase [Janthinobacterium lividum]
MTWYVRPAVAGDIDALLELAHLTGGGFTNLPPDRDALARRLAKSDASFGAAIAAPVDEMYLLILEQTSTRRIGGTAVVFSRVGSEWPFYSYKLSSVSQTSRELGTTFSMQLLNLVTDHDGASEVGGLFLHPDLRTGGLGKLLARSRYLFIAQSRERFGDRLLAELRGVMTDDGNSPFWDGLGKRFFGMDFRAADKFNSLNGNQFIADLMPKHPIYVALLPESARAVIGLPHDRGAPAMRMLEAEGFRFENYVDVFDGGPTMTVRTDMVRTVVESRAAHVTELAETGAGLTRSLLASGRLGEFRSWIGHAERAGASLILPRGEAEVMDVKLRDEVRHVGF